MFSTTKGEPVAIDLHSKTVLKIDTKTKRGKEDFGDRHPLTREQILIAIPQANDLTVEAILDDDIDSLKNAKTIRYKIDRFRRRFFHDPHAEFIPILGERKWDGHFFISGATGAGKSFFAKELLLRDIKKRKIYLFTDLEDELDPSLIELYQSRRMKRVIPEGSGRTRFDIHLSDVKFENAICIFDDIHNSSYDKLALRHNILERGRHKNTVCIVVCHKLRDHQRTIAAHNESRWLVTFPGANRGAVMGYLRDIVEMPRTKREEIVDLAKDDGRYLFIHAHQPNFVLTSKSALMV